MTHLESGQTVLPHLRLTAPQVFDLWESGHYTPKGYLYHLVLAHKRAGWWWRIENVAEFCREWKINRRTFYRAKAALVNEGIFEESITGSIDLRVASTNVCVTSVSPVPDLSQRVPDLSQAVTDGSQVAAETTAEERLQETPDLLQIFKQTTTTEEMCVTVENPLSQELETQEGIFTDWPDSKVEKQSTQASGEKIFTPPILQRAKKLGVNVRDRSLLSTAKRWPERISVALDCLEEKSLTAKYPTRFLQKAIEEDWRPERAPSAPTGFGEWFNEARRRGLAIASEMRDNALHIFTTDHHWLPFEQLRQIDWDDLETRLKPITASAGDAPPTSALGT